MNDICDYCGARRWVKGSRHFNDHIRSYNTALAFTSCSFKPDTRIDFSRGVQCFHIHGALYHFQGPLEPTEGDAPGFAQLFFYDPQYANQIPLQRHIQLKPDVLGDLTEWLTHNNNPFIRLYRTARERLADQQEEFRIILNPQMR
jgi:hypothetical protein